MEGLGMSNVAACRSCGSDDLAPFLDLGATPVANALVEPCRAAVPDPAFPLNLLFCRRCSLVQLGFEIPADVIFDTDYPYFSSFSDALCRHAADHVAGLIEARQLGPESLIVELASNDGYLLKHALAAGVQVVGIDPSPGPAAAAEAIGVPTVCDFFGTELSEKLAEKWGRKADVIIANNVMAHVPDLNDFVGGMAVLLADDGVITVENPYVLDLIEQCQYDTVYHEHYCYFSCAAVDALMHRHGLHLNDVEYFPDLHGGTLRWTIGKASARTPRCEEALYAEREVGMLDAAYYERFADRVNATSKAIVALLEGLRREGKRVAAYGAAAKGATLLNSAGIGTDLVEFVVDRNVHKQGKLMPGARLPIRPVEALLEEPPDYVLLLAWNFKDEIVQQQQEYQRLGGRFIVPVPTPTIL
jgi:SAM-dependent methyltransferase